MKAFSPQVLPLYDPPRQKSYRAAIAKIVRDLKARHGLSNVTLAEALHISAETVGNAENENNDLSAVTLAMIAWVYGEEAIGPFRELYRHGCCKPVTMSDRIGRIEREAEAIRNEISTRSRRHDDA